MRILRRGGRALGLRVARHLAPGWLGARLSYTCATGPRKEEPRARPVTFTQQSNGR